jgi:hypothetical protein
MADICGHLAWSGLRWYRVDNDPEIRPLLSIYMCAVTIYQRALLQWLGRFDARISPKGERKSSKEWNAPRVFIEDLELKS